MNRKVYLEDSCNTVYPRSMVGFEYVIAKPCLRAIKNNNYYYCYYYCCYFGTDQSVNTKYASVF